MIGKNKERWEELCKLATKEQDPQKLIELMKEIDRLLEIKLNRLKGAPHSAGSSFAAACAQRFSVKSKQFPSLQPGAIGKFTGSADAPGSVRFSSARPPDALSTNARSVQSFANRHAP